MTTLESMVSGAMVMITPHTVSAVVAAPAAPSVYLDRH